MKNLYTCLEQGKLGIFESPTGTGKSLSLICGSLTWLEDHELKKKTDLEKELAKLKITNSSSDDPKLADEPSWFTLAKENVAKDKMQNSVKQKLENILLQEEKIIKLKERVKAVKLSLAEENKIGYTKPNSWSKETSQTSKDKCQIKMDSQEDADLIIDFQSDESDCSDDEEHSKTGDEKTKIIFASRTHSQISQFVKEVVKSPFGKQVRVCTLASRAQLCINEDVLKLKNSSLINEKCLDMQKKKEITTTKSAEGRSIKKSKSKSDVSSCPFMNSQRVQEIRDLSLLEIGDIESLTKTSQQHKACPYYAARSAISDAQLIVVPYATLLHKSTREACGLNLRNSVVIIDEAHNLLETISSIHNVSISGAQISLAHFQLTQYQQKFSTRLSSKNLLHIKQLLFFLSCLLKALGISIKTKNSFLDNCNQPEEKVYDPINFSVEVGFDHLNMHKLVEFCEKSKLPQKLAGFQPTVVPEVSPLGGLTSFLDKIKPKVIISNEMTPPQTMEENSGRSPLMTIVDFMRNLRNPSVDGRVLVVKKTCSSKSFFKYLLLNPAALFQDFVTEPRSVVVAGGTMQPHYEFKYSLFVASGADQERVMTFSCGHIIPANHVLPLVLTRGSTNKELDFSWGNRNKLLDELYSLILNMIQVVSGGVVCFLPSYDFEQQVMDHFEKKNYIAKIESRKKLFREPKKANEVDAVLAEYSQCIRMCKSNFGTPIGRNGAFLLCVIGGKLSEGINFSDDLARCVIVVGLPYANIKSAELKEKMDYLNSTTMNLRPEGEGRLPGQLYYESLCFKAVNQSIGRAIRHKEDYAVLILADARYSRPGSKCSLPEWIAQELTVCQKFGPSVALVRKFLMERQKSSNVETKLKEV